MSDESRSEPEIEVRGPIVKLHRGPGYLVHPWVYRRAIMRSPRGLRSGDEVAVVAADGTPQGRGFYHGSSLIAVRLLSGDPNRPLDEAFFRERLERAVRLRKETLRLERVTNAYRVVHAEGDGLSGLIVDRYADLLVVEFFSKCFFLRRKMISRLLLELFPDSKICLTVNSNAARHEGMQLPRGEESEDDASLETEVHEGKMRFLVDPSGHKTGFFLDQRDNRRRFCSLVKGRKVLDAFSYTGGFAIAARTLGKASRVVALDLDENAIPQGKRNARLNRTDIEWIHADAFPYLRNQRHAAEPFDAMCIDPPKWVTSRDVAETAERKYLDINRYAIQALRRGGILLTCSCSGLVSEENFLRILFRAAAEAERGLQVFQVTGAAPDHPVDIHCPESRYLKAVFARVV